MKVSVWFWVRVIVLILCIFITINLRVYYISALNDPNTAFTFDVVGACCVLFLGIDIGLHSA